MRLIDADALKFKNVAEVNGILTHILTAEEINNATTAVDLPELKEAYQDGYKDGQNERPQGKWLDEKYVAFHLTCNQCGCNLRRQKNEVFEGDFDYNFCPNCGADMRGEGI